VIKEGQKGSFQTYIVAVKAKESNASGSGSSYDSEMSGAGGTS